MSKQPNPPPPGDKPVKRHRRRRQRGGTGCGRSRSSRSFALWLFLPGINVKTPVSLSYSQFVADASAHKIKTVDFANGSSGVEHHGDRGPDERRSRTRRSFPATPTTTLTQQLSSRTA